MEKINVAELLKDCPKGMELDCTAFLGPVTFDGLDKGDKYPIRIRVNKDMEYLDCYGCVIISDYAKCVIFPKGKTTWEGFIPPCKFKDGDVVAVTMIPEGIWTGIFKEYEETYFESHCYLNTIGEFRSKGFKNHSLIGLRFATQEEKTKLFDAIKANGYKWNAETKTLEELIEPKFKVVFREERLECQTQLINKACDWLYNKALDGFYNEDGTNVLLADGIKEQFIESFKKAMKE